MHIDRQAGDVMDKPQIDPGKLVPVGPGVQMQFRERRVARLLPRFDLDLNFGRHH